MSEPPVGSTTIARRGDQMFPTLTPAEIERVLVGIAVTTRGTRLVNALVHPAYRGLGVGRALVDSSGAVDDGC